MLVAQDRLSVESFLRRWGESDPAGNGDHWILSAAADLGALIHLGSLGLSVPLTEIYDGVEFPTGAGQAPSA